MFLFYLVERQEIVLDYGSTRLTAPSGLTGNVVAISVYLKRHLWLRKTLQ